MHIYVFCAYIYTYTHTHGLLQTEDLSLKAKSSTLSTTAFNSDFL